MNAVRVTFDSNVWRKIVAPLNSPKDPALPQYEAIRAAIEDGRVAPFTAETVVTLEAVQRGYRREFLTDHFSNKPPAHPGMHAILEQYVRDAAKLGFRLLDCPRFGGVDRPSGIDPALFAVEDASSVVERKKRFTTCVRDIENHDAGIAWVKRIGEKYRDFWLQGLIFAPPSEDTIIAKAVGEWADGDAIAAHHAYIHDYFCTYDTGTKSSPTGIPSVLHATNRSWLAANYGVVFVTPEDLVSKLPAAG